MSNTDAHHVTAATNEGQQQPKPVTIAFVLYPGFTALDIIGPFQVLAYVPGHEAVFVAASPGRSPTTPAAASSSHRPASISSPHLTS